MDYRILVWEREKMNTIKKTKIFLLTICGFLVLIIMLAQFGLFSARPPQDLGFNNNRLKAPSANENSVSSQADLFSNTAANIKYAKIEPLNYRGSGKVAFAALKQQISNSFKEARLIEENENYLRYEFKTGIMKFTDDVEFLLNQNENYIHFRSASRLGKNDFGTNRERIEEIRKKFKELNKNED